jgi:hypothetical protein
MVFQVIYALCVLLWLVDPALPAACDLSELFVPDYWELHLRPDREGPVRLDCRDYVYQQYSLAVVEDLTRVGWHLLSGLMPALRTGNCRCFSQTHLFYPCNRSPIVR